MSFRTINIDFSAKIGHIFCNNKKSTSCNKIILVHIKKGLMFYIS